MKALWKYIPPFAPDQSGACAVLCELGGLIVIIDAGGCAGNICGFDEPRWFSCKSAIFSAGLRDMDAILGRDEKLVDKTVRACEQIDSEFVALIGTPVPAVIGTDYRALKRMIHKRTGLPVITVESTGTQHYDKGAEKAFLELVKSFVRSDEVPEQKNEKKGDVLYFGATPLDTDGIARENWFGMGTGIEALSKKINSYDMLQVISPSAIAAAKLLKEKAGIDFFVAYPLETISGYESLIQFLNYSRDKFKSSLNKGKTLILHQQILANSIREKMEESWQSDLAIDVCSWFMMDKAYMRKNDRILKEEDDWISLVNDGGYDLVIADPILKKAIPEYKGIFISLPHYALSGRKLTLEGFSLDEGRC